MTISTDSPEIAAAAEVFSWWNSTEVLGSMSMIEGHRLAELFELLGRTDTAEHILREVWEGEDEGSRDPFPLIDAAGLRRSPQDLDEATALTLAFQPRLDYYDHVRWCDSCRALVDVDARTEPLRCNVCEGGLRPLE